MDIKSTTDMTDSESADFELDMRLLEIVQKLKGMLDSTPRIVSNKDVQNIVSDGVLHQVVSHGNEWMTRHLIELGANVDTKVNDVTPLMVAMKKGNRELVEMLLEVGANINITDHFKIQNSVQTYMIPNMSFYPNFCVMKTILNALNRKMSMVIKFTKEIIERGFSVFEMSFLGNIDMVKYMLDQGMDVNCKGKNFTTALHNSVYLDNLKMVEFLLDNGADVNALDNFGRTPIFYGVHYGRYNIVEILLQRGANPNAVCTEYPLILWSIIGADFTIEPNWTKPEEKSRYARSVSQCIVLLLQHGADPQIRDLRQSIFKLTHALDKKYKESWNEDIDSIGSVNLIIAHLAMTKMLGKPILKRTRKGMNDDLRYKKYYQLCRRILKAKIFKSMTLFDLLTESDNKMKIYLRNRKFVSKMIRISHKHELAIDYPYYFNTLKKRISRITKEMRLEYFAAKAISDISSYNMSHMITAKIIGFLDQQSLEKLVASAEVNKLLKRTTPLKIM